MPSLSRYPRDATIHYHGSRRWAALAACLSGLTAVRLGAWAALRGPLATTDPIESALSVTRRAERITQSSCELLRGRT